jgi:DNA-binding GntR family transcriptional regulator
VTAPRFLSRQVLAEQVRDRLLEGILNGRYPPDSRIVETRVAKELGTSQAPVREALRSLEALGVVEISPFRGARVRRPTRRELLDAYVVRSNLEALGARLAVPNLTPTSLAELTELVERMESAAEAGDGHAVAEFDVTFHGRIVALSDNRTLEKVWRSLEPFSRTYITLMAPGADPKWTVSLHRPILEALLRRDPDAVVAALEWHFVQVRDNMARRWRDPGENAANEATERARAG